MSDTMASLRRKIDSANDLQSVVRTMKAVAASSIGQYEKSVRALADYYRTVELGLGACFRSSASSQAPSSTGYANAAMGGDGRGTNPSPSTALAQGAPSSIGVVVFGSDQGLVGQFNEAVAAFALEAVEAFSGSVQVWAVGERVEARLADAGMTPRRIFAVPNSVKSIGPLVGEILVETETNPGPFAVAELHLFYNRPTSGSIYAPVRQRLLPLDESWRRHIVEGAWPGGSLPEVLGGDRATMGALIREYLFISLFRACAESLASENASRLSAMQRADKNIDDLLEELSGTFHRLRQSSIDEELFDVISSVEALSKGP